MKVKWEKKGLIYVPTGDGFLKSYATRPIPYLRSNGILRIYFASRCEDDMPYPTFIDILLDHPEHIVTINDRPMMSLGRKGTFDDSGITPVSILRDKGEDRMYYVGWKRRRYGVSFESSVGLALLQSGGDDMVRAFDGPIIGQDINHPLMTAAPFVLFNEGRYKMWYCSGTDWRVSEEGNPEPIYTVYYAESKDGINWVPFKRPVIEYKYDGEVISAPWIIKNGSKYHMWYSTRGYVTKEAKNYVIGYAESDDGIKWKRMDDKVGIERSASGWDSEMICYPSFFPYGDLIYMFYSGNQVGKGGIGYAISENFLK